jgi:hypothetical protein
MSVMISLSTADQLLRAANQLQAEPGDEALRDRRCDRRPMAAMPARLSKIANASSATMPSAGTEFASTKMNSE